MILLSFLQNWRIFVILKLADVQLADLEELCSPILDLTGGPLWSYDC